MDFTRAASDDTRHVAPLHTLTTKQRRLLEAIDGYQRATGEACPAALLGRRLHVHHSTIQKHLATLHRKGWLRSPNAPARLDRDIR